MEVANEDSAKIDPIAPDTLTQNTCKSCGHVFTGLYCNACGEKVLTGQERTFQSFVRELDPRNTPLLKSFLLIIRNPGFLSKEHVEGRRVNYVRPLQLFFILNLIYFLFPLLQLFNTSLRTQMTLRTHSKLVRTLVQSKIGRDGLNLEGYSLLYNEKSTSLAKMLVIVFVFLASLPMMVIYRKRNRYFQDHITLAVELTSFNLAVNAIFLSLFLVVVNRILHWSHSSWHRYLDDTTLTIIFVLTNVYFLFRAGKTFYNQHGYALLIKVVLGLLGLFLALELYRLILFLVTFLSL